MSDEGFRKIGHIEIIISDYLTNDLLEKVQNHTNRHICPICDKPTEGTLVFRWSNTCSIHLICLEKEKEKREVDKNEEEVSY